MLRGFTVEYVTVKIPAFAIHRIFHRGSVSSVVRRRSYLVWGPEEPVDAGHLVDERDVLPEGVQRRSRRFGEIGAVERIGVV